MRIEILDGLGRPLVLSCTRVLITGDDGTPASFSVQTDANTIKTAHAGEPGGKLNQLLKNCGVDRTVVTEFLQPRQAVEILRP